MLKFTAGCYIRFGWTEGRKECKMAKKDEPWFKLKKFLTAFIDPYNYHEYRWYESDKCVYPKQTNAEIISKSCANRICHKNITNQVWGEHFFGKKILGYNTKQNKQLWLILLDFDSYKSSPIRFESLQRSVELVEEFLGEKIYIEKSTHSNDLHGFIVVNRTGYSVQESISTINTFISYMNVKCKEVGLKELEVMGLPNIYSWEERRIISITSNTPAKLPRSLERIQDLIQSPVIHLENLKTPTEEHGGDVDCLTNSKELQNNKSVNFAPFNAEKLEESLAKIWDKCSDKPHFEFTKGRYLTQEDWVNYSLTWIKAVYKADKQQGKRRGTAPVTGLKVYYGTITSNNFAHRTLKWVGEQLESFGILICVNRGYTVGIMARRWKVRIKALDNAVKIRTKLAFKQDQVVQKKES